MPRAKAKTRKIRKPAERAVVKLNTLKLFISKKRYA
jgi:hypothetical protein